MLADVLADYFLPTNACFIQMKNTLTHIVNYEKTIFDKKIIWKVATWRLSTYKKTFDYFRSKKAYGLKISESVIYVK